GLWGAAAAGLLGAAAMVGLQAWGAGVLGYAAVWEVAPTAVATVLLFAVCGYAPTRLLLPDTLRHELALFVLPVGAACAALELTVLGLLRVPLPLALGVVLGASAMAGAGLAAHDVRTMRAGRREAGGRSDQGAAGGVTHAAPRWTLLGHRLVPVLLPLALAALAASLALIPVFRTGFATVIGQNGDAVMAVGTAELLRSAPPTAVEPALPVDQVPIVWRSKLPIYYVLAGVAELTGQTAVAAFATVSAVLLGLVSLGLFLLARHLFAASLGAAAAVTFLVPLDRTVLHLAIHPYYNQLWGLLTLPFTLLFGWRFLERPSRRTLAPLALFALLGVFAYPLLLPFPALFLGVVAWLGWRRARVEGRRPGWIAALGLPRVRSHPVGYAILGVLCLPVVAVLVRGVIEKTWSAGAVVFPGGDLSGWSGPALPYLPFARFFGVEGTGPLAVGAVVGILALAVLGARALRREVAMALGVMTAGALGFALSFYLRGQGELFYFKILSFLGPLVLALGVVGLWRACTRAPRAPARVALGVGGLALVVALAAGTARELGETYEYATAPALELARWDERLPEGASVRIDVPPSGYQLWTWYMLDSRPVSIRAPLTGFFPHPPRGLAGDFALTDARGPRPPDALGTPVLRNDGYAMYRLRPGPRLPDTSSRRLVWPYTEITYGG
ncbi:MAG TPA: hypothetical protein VGV40_01240, partial [Solirubrobacteraceae bacterium]|nr:hypothetical protein [Solirubrobacteraceae bacterium]